jgi:hypothetical protein
MQQKFLIDPKQKQLFFPRWDGFFFFLILLLMHLGFVEANAPQEEETVMMMALTMLRFHN